MIRAVEEGIDVVCDGKPSVAQREADRSRAATLVGAEPNRVASARRRVRDEGGVLSIGDWRGIEPNLERYGGQSTQQSATVVGYQEGIVAAVIVYVEASVNGMGRREVGRSDVAGHVDCYGGRIGAAVAVAHRVGERVYAGETGGWCVAERAVGIQGERLGVRGPRSQGRGQAIAVGIGIVREDTVCLSATERYERRIVHGFILGSNPCGVAGHARNPHLVGGSLEVLGGVLTPSDKEVVVVGGWRPLSCGHTVEDLCAVEIDDHSVLGSVIARGDVIGGARCQAQRTRIEFVREIAVWRLPSECDSAA